MANKSKLQKTSSSLRRGDLKHSDKVARETSKNQGDRQEKGDQAVRIENHTVKASKENPQVLVESDKTGKQAAQRNVAKESQA
jgi:hypothetical protein